MNTLLLFLLKSSVVFSLLYLLFRLLMRQETSFMICRLLILFIVFASVTIPFINLPQVYKPLVGITLDPALNNSGIVKPLQDSENYTSTTNVVTVNQTEISSLSVIILIYLAGVLITFLLLLYNIYSIIRLLRKSQKVMYNGLQIRIINADISAFSFMRYIVISRNDYDSNEDAIITHEIWHIKNGHFYDLMLLELIKTIYWYNPLVYKLIYDLKDIHEFQADEQTLKSGVDSASYQLLLIQRCVGHQLFALANSFNHCQIKNRITMMNKLKTSKAMYWKVAAFLPLLALLLMAFGNKSEIVPEERSLPVTAFLPSNPVSTQKEQFKRKIEIKTDGNYIDNKTCSLEEIAKKWRRMV